MAPGQLCDETDVPRISDNRWASSNATGATKNAPVDRQVFSSDILYDTLNKYDPGHLMLKITRDEAMKGLVDFGRIEEMLKRTQGRIDHLVLDRVTPLAAPLFLEHGRVPVFGEGREKLLETEAERLMSAAGITDL